MSPADESQMMNLTIEGDPVLRVTPSRPARRCLEPESARFALDQRAMSRPWAVSAQMIATQMAMTMIDQIG